MIVAFTGHRPNKLPGGYDIRSPKYDPLKNEMRRILTEIKPEKAISGMALGVDTIAAHICVELGIPFIAAIPFEGQEKAWPQASQADYRFLITLAKERVVVCEGGYAAWKMQKRNEWMCDNCDKLIAVWDGSSGGTGNCVGYAEKIGKEIIRIHPTVTAMENNGR